VQIRLQNLSVLILKNVLDAEYAGMSALAALFIYAQGTG